MIGLWLQKLASNMLESSNQSLTNFKHFIDSIGNPQTFSTYHFTLAFQFTKEESASMVSRLNSIAMKGNSKSSDGLIILLRDICVEAIRRNDAWVAACADQQYYPGNEKAKKRGINAFHALSIDERSKYPKDEISNFHGTITPSERDSPVNENGRDARYADAKDNYLLLNILIAAAGPINLLKKLDIEHKPSWFLTNSITFPFLFYLFPKKKKVISIADIKHLLVTMPQILDNLLDPAIRHRNKLECGFDLEILWTPDSENSRHLFIRDNDVKSKWPNLFFF
jgi:hypothetical protein